MSKPRRQPGPILRPVITSKTPTTPGQNLLLRTPTPVAAPAPVRNRRSVKMTGAQRDAQGRYSDWNRPANLRPGSTPLTAAWSHTASDSPRGGVYKPAATSRTVPPAR